MSIGNVIYDPKHPWRSPLVGRFLSRTVCALGHSVVVKSWDRWDDGWVACAVCGARFVPAETLAGADENE